MPCCELKHRALVRLAGKEAIPFLQTLVTQDVAGLGADRPLYAALLDPQGKTLFPLFLFGDGNDVLIDVARDDRAALSRQLGFYRLGRAITVADEPGLAIFQQWGEEAGKTPHAPDPRTPLAGARFVAPLGAPAGRAGDPIALWHRHRLPLGLAEADEIGRGELLWLEANAHELHGVSFRKGCYIGQENIARMHHRGKVAKRLLPVRFADEAAKNVAADAAIFANMATGARKMGMLRGVRHGAMQMALLKVEALGAELSAGGAPLAIVRPPWLGREERGDRAA